MDMSSPPRSRFYHLEPIGVGTPLVESFTGYMIRLAEAYHVTPKELIVHGILPAHKGTKYSKGYYRDHYGGFWSHQTPKLNGSSWLAQEWVETLQILTSCNNLHSLTLLPWNEDMSDGIDDLRSFKSWCPCCYEEWRQHHQVIYEPLLWALEGVRFCLQHEQELVSRCPYCRAKFTSPGQKELPGHCAECTRWLGATHLESSKHHISYDTDEYEFERLIVQKLGEALASGLISPSQPTQTELALMDRLNLKQALKQAQKSPR